MRSRASGGGAVFGCDFGFWLLVPFPLWLLGAGFAGKFVFLPDIWDLITTLWFIAFYAPLLLLAFVAICAIRAGNGAQDENVRS